MIIEYELGQYLLDQHSTMQNAAKLLTKSGQKVVFVVDSNNRLQGVLTIGDILRAQSTDGFSNDQLSEKYFNRVFHALKESELSKNDYIEKKLKLFAYLPIIDEANHIIGVARRKLFSESIQIEEFEISKKSNSFIIAEIGNNHNGDIDLAKKLARLAKESGADCVKFQMRSLDNLYHSNEKGSENLGEEYVLDLLERFQLSFESLCEVFDYCKEIGVLPLCTPWDEESLEVLENYGMPAYKVSSADLTNHEFLVQIAKTGKPMICSTGMSTLTEIRESVELLNSVGAKFVMLHCNSTYPTPFSDINLNFLHKLSEITNSVVGYSGHERGIEVPIASIAMGAKVIEKHFTIDQDMEGNDHKVSLLPEQFKKMVQAIRNVESSLGLGEDRSISQGEMMNRVTLAKSLIINTDIKAGDEVLASMLTVKSPGKGLQPNLKNKLIGRKITRNMSKGDFFYPSDLNDQQVDVENYNFNIAWGVPVRYHDFKAMLEKCPNMPLVEFHLSYRDLDVDLDSIFEKKYDIQYVVHAPELFYGDHILDLCSLDEEYRKRSIEELNKVIAVTLSLKKYFKDIKKPKIVVNVGGFTKNAPLGKVEREALYEMLSKSLDELNSDDVEIIPQTMPPFPWHMGGQQFHNLFVDPDEIVNFCLRTGYRVCFDVSHSGLACNHNRYSFTEFIDKVLPYSAHLHIADALGDDGEGLQILEGNLDFKYLFKKVNELNSSDISFIPEVWQGHENTGEGFWIAFNRLKKIIN